MNGKQFLAFLALAISAAQAIPTSANDLHPDILAAMKRDLGLNPEQAAAQITRDLDLSKLIKKLEDILGNSFAGGWIDGDKAFIGVTDRISMLEVKALGGTPILMANSLLDLRKFQKLLDNIFMKDPSSLPEGAADGIASWGVDLASNKLIIDALRTSRKAAKELAERIGLKESEFDIRTVTEMPTTMAATIRGGDAYYFGGRCSIGFSVKTGFVTAGHCGKQGTKVSSTSGGETMGTVGGAIFPGSDMGHVGTVQGTTLTPNINGYGKGSFSVKGNQEAAEGAKICRSGSTTGVQCGTVQQRNTSVRYKEGTIQGVTKSNACCEPGDSGGSWFVGGEAQGVTSGGSGNCKSGGTSYFQPLNPILSKWNLQLVTG